VQKILAHAGLGSRRECEAYILQGRVTIDGKVVRELGTRVDAGHADIAVDGERIKLEKMVYYAVHKPKGYVSTNQDPSGRPRVVDLLPEVPERVYSVGRLDEDTTGLMILTNDGDLANRLAHPRFGVEKTYRALVAGTPAREVVGKLTEGIWLSDGKVRAKRARVVGTQGEATLLELVLAEGKKREIRRMLAKLGHKVMSLTRIAIGPVVLKGLPPGEHRPLSRAEIDLLRKVAAGVPVAPPRFSEPRHAGRKPRPFVAGPNRPPGKPVPRDDRPRHDRDRAPRPSRPGGAAARRKPMPGKPVAGNESHGKPLPGKAPPGKPAQTSPASAKAPLPPRPPRRIVGLAPRVAAEAGLTLSGRPPRKRPGIRRRPPRKSLGVKRSGEAPDER
jgi:23S rRNA pseudouridine2605 synthase